MHLKIQNKRFASVKYLKKFKMKKKASSEHLKKIRIKEPWAPIVLKISKKVMGFMKELVKCWSFSMQLFDFFKRMKTTELYIEIGYLISR
jgi:hypothetical protein